MKRAIEAVSLGHLVYEEKNRQTARKRQIVSEIERECEFVECKCTLYRPSRLHLLGIAVKNGNIEISFVSTFTTRIYTGSVF